MDKETMIKNVENLFGKQRGSISNEECLPQLCRCKRFCRDILSSTYETKDNGKGEIIK